MTRGAQGAEGGRLGKGGHLESSQGSSKTGRGDERGFWSSNPGLAAFWL